MTSFRAHRLLLVYLLRTQRWHERFLKNRNSLTKIDGGEGGGGGGRRKRER